MIEIPIALFVVVVSLAATGLISWAAFATKNMLALARALDVSNTQLSHLAEQVSKLTEQVRQLELSQARHTRGEE
jgi:CII-binding regulator of phage lambda lysogenization HflD